MCHGFRRQGRPRSDGCDWRDIVVGSFPWRWPMPESYQEKLKRVRSRVCTSPTRSRPRAREVIKELPFVMGVIGNFSGSHPTQELRPLEDRSFVEINRDNFNNVMKRMARAWRCGSRTPSRATARPFPVQLAFNSTERFRAGQHHPAGRAPQETVGNAQPAARPRVQGRPERGARRHPGAGPEERADLKQLSSELGVKGDAAAARSDAMPQDDRQES